MLKFLKRLFGLMTNNDKVDTIMPKSELLFNHENVEQLLEKDYKRLKSSCGNFYYGCYKIGNSVAVNKSGANFGNAGSHGIYVYSINNKNLSITSYKYMDDLVEILLKADMLLKK